MLTYKGRWDRAAVSPQMSPKPMTRGRRGPSPGAWQPLGGHGEERLPPPTKGEWAGTAGLRGWAVGAAGVDGSAPLSPVPCPEGGGGDTRGGAEQGGGAWVPAERSPSPPGGTGGPSLSPSQLVLYSGSQAQAVQPTHLGSVNKGPRRGSLSFSTILSLPDLPDSVPIKSECSCGPCPRGGHLCLQQSPCRNGAVTALADLRQHLPKGHCEVI